MPPANEATEPTAAGDVKTALAPPAGRGDAVEGKEFRPSSLPGSREDPAAATQGQREALPVRQARAASSVIAESGKAPVDARGLEIAAPVRSDGQADRAVGLPFAELPAPTGGALKTRVAAGQLGLIAAEISKPGSNLRGRESERRTVQPASGSPAGGTAIPAKETGSAPGGIPADVISDPVPHLGRTGTLTSGPEQIKRVGTARPRAEGAFMNARQHSPAMAGGEVIRSQSAEKPALVVTSPVLDREEPILEAVPVSPNPHDPRAQASGQTVPGSASSGREQGALILRRSADALASALEAQTEVIELKLKPEELGQLRFRIANGDMGLTLNVAADRPETLDLLRRNVDQLARQLSDLGYGSASFSFGEERSGAAPHSPQGGPSEAGETAAPQIEAVQDPTASARRSDGLDMRI